MTLLRIKVAAERLAVSDRTVRRLVAQGDLVAHRIGRGCIRVEAASVDAYLKRTRIPQPWAKRGTAS